ncbi:MAG: patatin-like phospholipase family protein [Candidatus Marinimicrobia bacterium]|nr:patatin-like phospholipase family protein [Candidatus Neomarinimicrobiota bacterium]
MNKFSIGFALGGGGARGAAHIGVLQALHASGIIPDYIAGTSAGAIIGAMYSATRDPDWVESRFREFLESEEFAQLGTDRIIPGRDPNSAFGQAAKFIKNQMVVIMALNSKSIIRREKVETAMRFLIPVETFEELQIPMTVVATDFHTGKPVEYSSGDLIEAISISSSIPGFVTPTTDNGQLLLDGGTSRPIPVYSVKNKVDYTIAVDISRGEPEPMQKVNILELMTRSERITSQHLCNAILTNADYIIRPEVEGLHWSQFERFDELYEAGIEAVENQVQGLLSELDERNSWQFRLKQWFGNHK